MDRNTFFMIDTGILWFAFGYALKGLDAAAVFFAVFAAVLAWMVNTRIPGRKKALDGILPVFTGLILLHISGLKDLFGSLPAVVICNILTCRWFLLQGTSDLRMGLRIEFYVMLGMLVLALAVPTNIIAEMIPDGRRAFADLILLLGLIFVPGMSVYVREGVRRSDFTVSLVHRRTMDQ
ncbi:MAG: hypothetical protein IKG46_00625 [Solobacterium sp.]|nr:hypothetical protein [Solobacterium sp.]